MLGFWHPNFQILNTAPESPTNFLVIEHRCRVNGLIPDFYSSRNVFCVEVSINDINLDGQNFDANLGLIRGDKRWVTWDSC